MAYLCWSQMNGITLNPQQKNKKKKNRTNPQPNKENNNNNNNNTQDTFIKTPTLY